MLLKTGIVVQGHICSGFQILFYFNFFGGGSWLFRLILMLVLSVLKNYNYFGSLLKFQFENHCFTFQVFFRHLTAFCEECASYSILWIFMTLFTEKHDKHLLMSSLLTNHFFDLDLIKKIMQSGSKSGLKWLFIPRSNWSSKWIRSQHIAIECLQKT